MNDDPVEVIEAMAKRAAVARRLGEAALLFLDRRRSDDPLAHARAEVRVRLAVAAATLGLRWLQSLESEGRVDPRRVAGLRAGLHAVLTDASHPSQVMDGSEGGPYCRTDTVTSVGSRSPRADFEATARTDADRT